MIISRCSHRRRGCGRCGEQPLSLIRADFGLGTGVGIAAIHAWMAVDGARGWVGHPRVREVLSTLRLRVCGDLGWVFHTLFYRWVQKKGINDLVSHDVCPQGGDTVGIDVTRDSCGSQGALLRFDPAGEVGDLVEQAASLGHELADLPVGMHHRGVVSAPECLADLGQ